MAKRRRRLDKNFEKKIYSCKKKIELVLAKIYDIHDEDIQKEYMSAFEEVVKLFDVVQADYDSLGFNENSESLISTYGKSLTKFESEFEI